MHAHFMLYDAKTAQPLALMEANYLGQIRTGAASGYATDLLANPQADTLAVIGSGFQAKTQVAAIRAVRPIKTVRIWSRDPEKRRKFAEDCGAQAVATPRKPFAALKSSSRDKRARSGFRRRLDRAWNHAQRDGLERGESQGTAE